MKRIKSYALVVTLIMMSYNTYSQSNPPFCTFPQNIETDTIIFIDTSNLINDTSEVYPCPGDWYDEYLEKEKSDTTGNNLNNNNMNTVELSVKKVKAYNKVLDVICTSTTTHHKDVAYILIERFAHTFQDDSLSEQLLEIADSELRELV